MASSEEKKMLEKIIKKASKQAVKTGLIKFDLPSNVASGIADQLAALYDLCRSAAEASKTSGTISPSKAAISLAQMGLGISKIVSTNRSYQCAVSVGVLGVGVAKAAGAFAAAAGTEGALAPEFLFEAASLLADIYSANETCGVSEAVEEKIEQVTLPIFQWLDRGIKDALGVSGYL